MRLGGRVHAADGIDGERVVAMWPQITELDRLDIAEVADQLSVVVVQVFHLVAALFARWHVPDQGHLRVGDADSIDLLHWLRI